jgi:hypothetical protein
MINFPLYRQVAEAMARLGIKPITEEEILSNRRDYASQGRRRSDGLGNFLLDHFILDAIQFLTLLFLYTFLHS